MSIFQAVTMPQDKIVSNSDGSLKPAWLSYFGQIERMSAALDAYTPPTPPAQKLAQVVSTKTGALASGTTQIPFDDTIPQITEGDQYLTVSITPTSASSTLIINVVLNLSFSVASTSMVAAVFQGATANAVASGAVLSPATLGRFFQISITAAVTAGTTSATAFTVRAGAGAAGTTALNGIGAANREYGGGLSSSITITEVLA